MRRPGLSLAALLFPCLALGTLLSACGGGGDSGTTAPQPPPPDPNQAPTAEITSPTDGTEIVEGETVQFEGEASDPEDGALSGSSLVWETEDGEQIGTGETVTMSDPPVGSHTITLTATDSEGASGSDAVDITVEEPADPPTVKLTAKLPRPDLDFSEALDIADGEAVVLAWETENQPETCTASGGWSGTRSTSGDTTETEGLSGPAELKFILRCENSGGADSDTVSVDIAAPGKRHAVSNRPDATDARQVKFFYVTCEGCRDRELDLGSTLADNFKAFQDRFFEETGDRFRVDTYVDGNGNERFDITFMVVDTTKGLSINDVMRKEMKRRGLYNRPENGGLWTLVRYYDGPNEGQCADGGANEVTIRTGNCAPTPTQVGHELLHGLYLVDKDAPNFDSENWGHVTDSDRDLMYFAPPDDGTSTVWIIDHNRDDYFCPDGCGEGVENLYDHPILTSN